MLGLSLQITVRIKTKYVNTIIQLVEWKEEGTQMWNAILFLDSGMTLMNIKVSNYCYSLPKLTDIRFQGKVHIIWI
jgi:hypothetical protein